MKIREFLKDNTEIIGPGTDLVISLVAIFMVLLVLNHLKHTIRIQELEKSLSKYQEDFESIKLAQLKTIEAIAEKANTKYKLKEDGSYVIPFSVGGSVDTITIINDATLQRFRFGNKILFDKGDYVLKSNGKEALAMLGDVIKTKKKKLREIQIQGHADPTGSNNLQLAGNRSQEVFKFFRKEEGINPNEYVMYASSFSEYMPTERKIGDFDWNESKTEKANKSENQKATNRRIEIVLNY